MTIQIKKKVGVRGYSVILGVQSFRLDYDGTKAECEWYGSMFRTALQAHEAEFLRAIAPRR